MFRLGKITVINAYAAPGKLTKFLKFVELGEYRTIKVAHAYIYELRKTVKFVRSKMNNKRKTPFINALKSLRTFCLCRLPIEAFIKTRKLNRHESNDFAGSIKNRLRRTVETAR